MRQKVSVVVLDLDDTLWDWVGMWHACFKAMLDELVKMSGVGERRLLADFKEVFGRHGTTEYAFAIEELASLRAKDPGENLPEFYEAAIGAYRQMRRQVLKLYPGVREALDTMKDNGVLLVGYTETKAFYSRYRLRKLGLDRVLDYLYSPADDDLPADLEPEQVRYYAAERYQLRRTIHRHTPAGRQKPAPEVLLQILKDVGAETHESIYVGDKLVKDIAMAHSAGVTDVHAKYGDSHDSEEYELLKQVTHWSGAAVRREAETTEAEVKPTYALEESLAELLVHFDFQPFIDKSPPAVDRAIRLWEKAVDVQQHFNNIEMKIRNFAIAVFAAFLGAAGLALKEGLSVTFAGWAVPLASTVLIAGMFALAPFYVMDRFWYHRLLYGAVEHAKTIEKRHVSHMPEIGLSMSISTASPWRIGRLEIHSSSKIAIFYGLLVVILLAAAVIVFLNSQWPPENAESQGNATSAPRLQAQPAGSQPSRSTGPRQRDPGLGPCTVSSRSFSACDGIHDARFVSRALAGRDAPGVGSFCRPAKA